MNAMDQDATRTTPTLPRAASIAWVDALAATASIGKSPHRLLCDLIEDKADIHGVAPALLSDRECLSFAELRARMFAVTRWAQKQGLSPGDRVALIMSNRPDYVALWLGLSKAGIVTALINTNLTGRSLAHCLEIARPSLVVVEDRFVQAYVACGAHWSGPERTPGVWLHGHCPGDCPRIDVALTDVDDTAPTELPKVSIDDPALLIYTSGTTGLPKAAHVSHRRVLNWALWFKGFLGNTEADRMYDCLPLYHSVGGVVAVAATLVAGGSTVIAEKFSARHFWDDIRRWECTQFQYIGELCRYLLNAPPNPRDGVHGLRTICGNGLRADVWERFRSRFAIPQVVEFYAATEGNFSLFNGEGRPGAVGRIPPYLRHRFPTAIVKFDADNGEPVRGDGGFCRRADVNEAGEAIGRISNAGDASGRFEGYTDARESERKILRDVFEKGDLWFRTGDLMRVDAAGYFFFVDRIGDTYRWKGENVSTLEVANVLSASPCVRDAVVYGVNVPGYDGRAGMALLEVSREFDPEAFRQHVAGELPAYAIPLFLRIGRRAALTETFKHKKQDLVRDGFDPGQTDDPIYVLTSADGCYRRMDKDLFAGICGGIIRL